MSLVYRQGDMFTSDAGALGHGVNCRGVMGAGIAVGFRERWPAMYAEYRKLCLDGRLVPGQIWPYPTGDGRWIMNVATQDEPGAWANLDWVNDGLMRAVRWCSDRGVGTLAVPRIGCGIGGLAWVDVQFVMETVAKLHPRVDLEVWTL